MAYDIKKVLNWGMDSSKKKLHIFVTGLSCGGNKDKDTWKKKFSGSHNFWHVAKQGNRMWKKITKNSNVLRI